MLHLEAKNSQACHSSLDQRSKRLPQSAHRDHRHQCLQLQVYTWCGCRCRQSLACAGVAMRSSFLGPKHHHSHPMWSVARSLHMLLHACTMAVCWQLTNIISKVGAFMLNHENMMCRKAQKLGIISLKAHGLWKQTVGENSELRQSLARELMHVMWPQQASGKCWLYSWRWWTEWLDYTSWPKTAL